MAVDLCLSERLKGLKPSATVEMTEKVRKLRSTGTDIIGLSSGDPNINTHPAIIEALNNALTQGETNYGPSQGKIELRKILSEYLTNRSGVKYAPEEIIVTPGGKFAVYAALQAIVNQGDEVLILEPGWVSYAPCVSLAGGIPIGVNCLTNIDAQTLEGSITPKTKAIIVNTPVNPTGRIISLNELKTVSALARKYNFWVISDEVYAELVYAPHVHTSIASMAGMKERTFLVDSFSKTFGMTGWRLGCLAMPEKHVKSILKTVQHSIYCVPPFIQTAALKAFELFPEIITEIRESFRERVNFAYNKLIALPGVTCAPPVATFYLFPDIQRDDVAFAGQLLDKSNLAVIPGSAFGISGKNHIRLSVSCSMELLGKAMSIFEENLCM